MPQKHSFDRLYFHLVFTTKNRQHLICSIDDGETLFGMMQVKATALGADIEEAGCWRDHVHLLVRCPAKLALSILYGQMKGFSAHAWNLKHPEQPMVWQDGVFSITVDPDHSEPLREYISSQWNRHEKNSIINEWELLNPDQ